MGWPHSRAFNCIVTPLPNEKIPWLLWIKASMKKTLRHDHTVTNSNFRARMGHTCTLQNFEIPDGAHTGLGIFLMVVPVCVVKCARMSPKNVFIFNLLSHNGFILEIARIFLFSSVSCTVRKFLTD